MNKELIAVVCTFLMSMMISCSTLSNGIVDERAQLRSVQLVYTATVNQVITLRKAGKISDKDFEVIKDVSYVISVNLGLWNEAIQAGKALPGMNDIILVNIEKLTELLLKYN